MATSSVQILGLQSWCVLMGVLAPVSCLFPLGHSRVMQSSCCAQAWQCSQTLTTSLTLLGSQGHYRSYCLSLLPGLASQAR